MIEETEIVRVLCRSSPGSRLTTTLAPIRARVGTAQVLAVLDGCGWAGDDDRYATGDFAGSGFSSGDPVCATGLQILATLTCEFRRRGTRFGSETMCIGGGPGIAAVIEAA